MAEILKFPDGFLWGVATSAFQVEGHPFESSGQGSDWSVWAAQGNIKDKTTAEQACEFYSRYPEDIKLCKELNISAFRIGLNWPALRPCKTDSFALDPDAVKYYRQMLEHIKQAGMKTFVTLFHFCLPQWLAEEGGWLNKQTVEEFALFTEAAAQEFGDLVDYWLTVNEPLVYVYQGYISGFWPPGIKHNYLKAFQAMRSLLEGHARAYEAIHRVAKTNNWHNPMISYAIHWRPFMARNKFNPLDQLVRFLRDQIFNHIFPQAVQTGQLNFPYPLSLLNEIKAISGEIKGLKQSLDYLGINYYTREICEFAWTWPIDVFGKQSDINHMETTDLGWEIYPQGLYYLLTEDLAPFRWDKDGNQMPIFITENGMATLHHHELSEGDWSLDDENRKLFLIQHIAALHKAIEDGANVKGYLYWSLLDNFEWAEGLQPRFGLVRISYPTQDRSLRKSAELYSSVAATNCITLPDPIWTPVK